MPAYGPHPASAPRILKCSTHSTDLIVHELAGVILLEQLDKFDDIRVLPWSPVSVHFLARSASNVAYGVIKGVVRAVAADDEHASLSSSSHLEIMRWVGFPEVALYIRPVPRWPKS